MFLSSVGVTWFRYSDSWPYITFERMGVKTDWLLFQMDLKLAFSELIMSLRASSSALACRMK